MTEKRESINESKQTLKITAAQCMSDANHSFRTKSKNIDGLNCPICKGPVWVKPFDEEEYYKLPYYSDLVKPSPHKRESISTLTVDVSVNVSEGIKALKALQREAKETVKVLKEVEQNTISTTNDEDKAERARFQRHKCLNCNHEGRVTTKESEYQKVMVCIECKTGAYVDTFFIHAYE